MQDIGTRLLVEEDNNNPNRYGLLIQHHILLQILWAKKTLTQREIDDVFNKIILKYQVTDNPTLDSYIQTINNAIRNLSFLIKKDRFENDVVYSIINTKKDDIVKELSAIPNDSITLFRILCDKLDEIDDNEDKKKLGINTLIQAMKDDYPKMTRSEFDSAVKNLLEEQYIQVDDDDYFTINNRARLENVLF